MFVSYLPSKLGDKFSRKFRVAYSGHKINENPTKIPKDHLGIPSTYLVILSTLFSSSQGTYAIATSMKAQESCKLDFPLKIRAKEVRYLCTTCHKKAFVFCRKTFDLFETNWCPLALENKIKFYFEKKRFVHKIFP